MLGEAQETIQGRVDAFVERARALSDDDRLAIAEARRAIAENFHEKALRAAGAWLPGRGELYARARAALASAHVPARLRDDDARGEDDERWNEAARLVQLAIDDMLLCQIASDVLHPDHLRELSRAWSASGAAPGADAKGRRRPRPAAR